MRSKLFLRRDRYGRFFSALVYIPRDRFNTDVRQRIEAMLKRELHGEHVDTTVQVGESPLAQLHMIVRPKPGERCRGSTHAGARGRAGRRSCATGTTTCASSWSQRTARSAAWRWPTATAARCRPATSRRCRRRSPRPTSSIWPRLTGPDDLRLSLYRAAAASAACASSSIASDDDIPLSDALPMMENMGLRVIAEHPYRLEIDGGDVVYIQDFEVEAAGRDVDIDAVGDDFEDAFARTVARRGRERRLQPPDPRRPA